VTVVKRAAVNDEADVPESIASKGAESEYTGAPETAGAQDRAEEGK